MICQNLEYSHRCTVILQCACALHTVLILPCACALHTGLILPCACALHTCFDFTVHLCAAHCFNFTVHTVLILQCACALHTVLICVGFKKFSVLSSRYCFAIRNFDLDTLRLYILVSPKFGPKEPFLNVY